MDLSNRRVKLTLNDWSVKNSDDKQLKSAIGKCIGYGSLGRTTEVIGIDKKYNRVLTRSGSIYHLGMPNEEFSLNNPEIMVELGFVSSWFRF
jgi:hypothetical protein